MRDAAVTSFAARCYAFAPCSGLLSVFQVREGLAEARDKARAALESAQDDVGDAKTDMNDGFDSLRSDIQDAQAEFDSAVVAIDGAADALEAVDEEWSASIGNLQDNIRAANDDWDRAVEDIRAAGDWLDDKKRAFREAQEELREVRREVSEVCTVRKKCKTNIGCHIRNKACRWLKKSMRWMINAAIAVLELPKVALSLAEKAVDAAAVLVDQSRVVLVVAEYALEAGEQAGSLALDAATATVSVASIVVDSSRFVLDIAVGTLEVARALGNVALDATDFVLEATKQLVDAGLWIGEQLLDFMEDAFVINSLGFDIELSKDQQTLEIHFKGKIFGITLDFKFTLDFKQALTLFDGFVKKVVEKAKKAFNRRRRGTDTGAAMDTLGYAQPDFDHADEAGNTASVRYSAGSDGSAADHTPRADAGQSAGVHGARPRGSRADSEVPPQTQAGQAEYRCHDCLLSIGVLFAKVERAIDVGLRVDKGADDLARDVAVEIDDAVSDITLGRYIEEANALAAATMAAHPGLARPAGIGSSGKTIRPSDVRDDNVVQHAARATRSTAEALARHSRALGWRSKVQLYFGELDGVDSGRPTMRLADGQVCDAFKCLGVVSCIRQGSRHVLATLGATANTAARGLTLKDKEGVKLCARAVGGCDATAAAADQARLAHAQWSEQHDQLIRMTALGSAGGAGGALSSEEARGVVAQARALLAGLPRAQACGALGAEEKALLLAQHPGSSPPHPCKAPSGNTTQHGQTPTGGLTGNNGGSGCPGETTITNATTAEDRAVHDKQRVAEDEEKANLLLLGMFGNVSIIADLCQSLEEGSTGGKGGLCTWYVPPNTTTSTTTTPNARGGMKANGTQGSGATPNTQDGEESTGAGVYVVVVLACGLVVAAFAAAYHRSRSKTKGGTILASMSMSMSLKRLDVNTGTGSDDLVGPTDGAFFVRHNR